jgi:hypothetical protein
MTDRHDLGPPHPAGLHPHFPRAFDRCPGEDAVSSTTNTSPEGRTSWTKTAVVALPAVLAVGALATVMARGALAASFAVSGRT